jgi:hypothetical protein
MPPGNARTKQPAKVVERVTVEACIAIAEQIQRSREQAGDVAGSEAAQRVARLIQEELLAPVRESSPLS